MLRISVQNGPSDRQGPISLVLEGRLTGAWVAELKRVWIATRENVDSHASIQIQLSSVSYISAAGAALLHDLKEQGAELIADSPLTREYIEDVQESARSEVMAVRLRTTDCCSGRKPMIKKHHPHTEKHVQHTEETESAPAHEEIAVRAYELWVKSGSGDGKHEEHWHQAEKELRGKHGKAH